MPRVVGIQLTLTLLGCSDERMCELPEHTEYLCEPVAAGGQGCAGGPVWVDGDGKTHNESPDLVFPFGCIAYVPMCGSYHANLPRRFECILKESFFSWSEPL